jgi:HAE1 family hydrophobic/amphiphilic exporter-1
MLLVTASLFLIPLVGSEFMPETDEGEVRVSMEMEVGTRLDVLDQQAETVEAIIQKEVPEIKNMVTFLGPSWRRSGSHTGEIRVALTPQVERSRSSNEIAADLRAKLTNVPGVEIQTRPGRGLFILRMGTGDTDKVQIEIRGYNLDVAGDLANRVKAITERVPGVTDAQISRDLGSPEELITVDRQKAADMKLTVSQIANALQTILSGTQAGNYREGGDEYRILVKIENSEQLDLRDILDLTLTNSDGQPIVLRNVVNVGPRSGPVMIERKDQERILTVSGDISGRDLGSVLTDIREELRTIPVPRDFDITFGGDYEEQQKAFRELLLGLILALVLVYMVMACQYESVRHPFVVMFSVPVAAIGVILMLFFTNTTFNIQSFIGCIMLGGIVVNNSILLVDHTNLLRRRDGMSVRQAVEEAGRRRLRPILMTAATTSVALLPLSLGLGEGGEAQAPMARAVIGGLLSSTLMSLILVPIVYTLLEGRSRDTKKQLR